MKRIFFMLFFIFILCAVPVFSDEYLINSRDWKDVYSGMLFANSVGGKAKFLVSEKHSTIIYKELNKEENLHIFSSNNQPYSIGLESSYISRGFNASEEKFEDLNLELAEKSRLKNFIIIDDAYGYNAVAVAPYAIVSESFVLFANSENIFEVQNLLEDVDAEDVIIYGQVDREVKEDLAGFDPEIINNEGDRFANNVEIVKKYKEIKKAKQVLLTNGEFIENEIMGGTHPVLFIGSENVPEKIKEYIVNSDIEVGVLIGNELVGTATTVRRQTGISTFVKFARSARDPNGPISQVEGLDLFPVPKIKFNLSIDKITYNSMTRQLEVTYSNDADVATYLRGTFTVKADDTIQTVGDEDAIFIESESKKTVVYELDPIQGDAEILVDIFVIYGESANSLERTIEKKNYKIDTIEIMDNSQISITGVKYNKRKNVFLVEIENTGLMDVFVNTEILDLIVAGDRGNYGSVEVIKIKPGKTADSVIKVEMLDEDIADNEKVKIRAFYGERSDVLIKMMEGTFQVETVSGGIVHYILLALIILVLMLLIIFGRKKKKNER